MFLFFIPIFYLVATIAMLHFIFPVGLTMFALALLVGGAFAAKFAG